jgi:magnesium transporter
MVSEQHQLNLIETIEELVKAGDLLAARALLVNRHPADQADILEELEDDSIRQLVATLEPPEIAAILEYLEDDYRRQVVSGVEPAELVPILDEVDEDLAADIVQDLPAEQAEQIVSLLEERETVEELLTHDENSVGGRMSTDVFALRGSWTTAQAIDTLREEQPNVDGPFHLYTVDDDGVLEGVVPVRNLLVAKPDTKIFEIMLRDVISARVDEDQEVAAERMRHYNMIALPVLDAEGRLVGVLTADDVLDVQVEEATEDMNLMAGLVEEERLFRPIRAALPPRLAWLSVNLITAFLAALTVNLFEGTIEKVATLAVFMPIIAGMGGNSGIQTITLVVRSIALGEIGAGDAYYALRHEVTIAAMKGVVLGLVVGFVAWLWKDSAWLGVVVGAALLTNIVVAAAVGVIVPLGLKLVRADPALAAGVIVTTFSDVIGFLTFLGLATIFVSKLS